MISSLVTPALYTYRGKQNKMATYTHRCSPTPDNCEMEKTALRQVLARNLQRAMDSSPAIDTQQKVAAKAGLSQQHVSRILKCETSAGVDVLQRLAKAVRCAPWELLVDDDATRKEALERMILRP